MWKARLAQSVERQTLNLVVEGSSPSVGASFLILLFLYLNVNELITWPFTKKSAQVKSSLTNYSEKRSAKEGTARAIAARFFY